MKKKVNAAIHRANNISGKGAVLAIVWGLPQYAGVQHGYHGYVIRQMQYGMDAKPFSLDSTRAGKHNQHVRFLGRWHKIV